MPEINFFWDPLSDNILQEWDEAGVVTAEYTTEPELYGNVISQRRQGQYRQFHYDGQGSTLAATDENQNVTDTFAYTAFGELTERTGTTIIPFQYIGQKGYYTDGLTGQIMARRRPYEPAGARWATKDVINLRNGIALYAYVSNSPLSYTDPSGLCRVVSFTVIDTGLASQYEEPIPTLESRAKAVYSTTYFSDDVLGPQCASFLNAGRLSTRCIHLFIVKIVLDESGGLCRISLDESQSTSTQYPADENGIPIENKGETKRGGGSYGDIETSERTNDVERVLRPARKIRCLGGDKLIPARTIVYFGDAPDAIYTPIAPKVFGGEPGGFAIDNHVVQVWNVFNEGNTSVFTKTLTFDLTAFQHAGNM